MLSSDDPKRAEATFKVMLESGDPEMRRIALENGIHSTNPVVRSMAVRAFLESEPVLELRIDGGATKREELQKVLDYYLKVLLDEKMQAVWIGTLGKGESDGTCYPASGGPGGCMLRVVGGTMQLRSTDGRWSELTLTDTGALQTVVQLRDVGAVTLTIPIR